MFFLVLAAIMVLLLAWWLSSCGTVFVQQESLLERAGDLFPSVSTEPKERAFVAEACRASTCHKHNSPTP